MIVFKGKRSDYTKEEFTGLLRGLNGSFCFEGDLTERELRRLEGESEISIILSFLGRTIKNLFS